MESHHFGEFSMSGERNIIGNRFAEDRRNPEPGGAHCPIGSLGEFMRESVYFIFHAIFSNRTHSLHGFYAICG